MRSFLIEILPLRFHSYLVLSPAKSELQAKRRKEEKTTFPKRASFSTISPEIAPPPLVEPQKSKNKTKKKPRKLPF